MDEEVEQRMEHCERAGERGFNAQVISCVFLNKFLFAIPKGI